MNVKELDELNAAFWVEQEKWAKTKDGSAEEKAGTISADARGLRCRT
jgi:hypothetical protein